MTESIRSAAVAAMRLVVRDGHMPRPLQEKATRDFALQSAQRARVKPYARISALQMARPSAGPGCVKQDPTAIYDFSSRSRFPVEMIKPA